MKVTAKVTHGIAIKLNAELIADKGDYLIISDDHKTAMIIDEETYERFFAQEQSKLTNRGTRRQKAHPKRPINYVAGGPGMARCSQLTLDVMNCFLDIDRSERVDVTPEQIREWLGNPALNVSGTLSNLFSRGMVSRQPNPNGRGFVYTLTTGGRRFLNSRK